MKHWNNSFIFYNFQIRKTGQLRNVYRIQVALLYINGDVDVDMLFGLFYFKENPTIY